MVPEELKDRSASMITARVLVALFSPSVSGNVIDRVRRYLRRVDQDISGLDEGSVGEIVALVVVHDRTEVGVGVADINCCRIAALNVD